MIDPRAGVAGGLLFSMQPVMFPIKTATPLPEGSEKLHATTSLESLQRVPKDDGVSGKKERRTGFLGRDSYSLDDLNRIDDDGQILEIAAAAAAGKESEEMVGNTRKI